MGLDTYRAGNCLRNFLRKRLEFPVQGMPTLSFLLLHLNLILVPVAMLALSIACLVELHVRGFAEELDVLQKQGCERVENVRQNLDEREPFSFQS